MFIQPITNKAIFWNKRRNKLDLSPRRCYKPPMHKRGYNLLEAS